MFVDARCVTQGDAKSTGVFSLGSLPSGEYKHGTREEMVVEADVVAVWYAVRWYGWW